MARTGHADVCLRGLALLRDVAGRAGARPVDLDVEDRERVGRD